MHSSKCGDWHILGMLNGEVRCVDCGIVVSGVKLNFPLQILRVVTDDV